MGLVALGKEAWFLLALAVLLNFGGGSTPRRRGSGAKGSKAMPYNWTDADMLAFIANVGPLGIPLADSLLVYTSESGLNPAATSGIAYGLCQLTQIAAKQIGWTRPLAEFGTLSVTDQAPWIALLQSAQIKIHFHPRPIISGNR